MSKRMSASELMAFNNRANLGSYLTSVTEIATSLYYVYSKNVSDMYCNLGYREDMGSLTKPQVEAVEKAAANKDRAPSIWQVAKQAIPDGYSVKNREVCMVAETKTEHTLKMPADVQKHVQSPLPAEAMVEVFDEVFIQTQDNIGYPAFAHPYVDVFRHGRPQAPARPFYTGLYINGECVAICHVTVLDKMAGLYSVAVRKEYRRRGLGRLVTAEGMKLAKQKGATRIMLFTSPNSPMQTMYESLGFEPAFVADILTKATKKAGLIAHATSPA